MDLINFEDFQKLDLRIGKIISAEKIEKSNKLLKFEVDLGEEKRIIVSGVAEYYEPEYFLEKQVVVILNLEARIIFGVESQGMILFAKSDKPIILSPEESVDPGVIIS